MIKGHIWILDDDESIRWVIQKVMTSAGFECRVFHSSLSVLDALEQQRPDVLISDIRMPNMDGITLLKHIKEHYPSLLVIIMTAFSDLDTTVNAFQTGAFDYLPKPFDIDDVVSLVERAMSHVDASPKKTEPDTPMNVTHSGIIGDSPAMQDVYRMIGRLSYSSITILINGESGTGKELIAQALHEHSPRKNRDTASYLITRYF